MCVRNTKNILTFFWWQVRQCVTPSCQPVRSSNHGVRSTSRCAQGTLRTMGIYIILMVGSLQNKMHLVWYTTDMLLTNMWLHVCHRLNILSPPRNIKNDILLMAGPSTCLLLAFRPINCNVRTALMCARNMKNHVYFDILLMCSSTHLLLAVRPVTMGKKCARNIENDGYWHYSDGGIVPK